MGWKGRDLSNWMRILVTFQLAHGILKLDRLSHVFCSTMKLLHTKVKGCLPSPHYHPIIHLQVIDIEIMNLEGPLELLWNHVLPIMEVYLSRMQDEIIVYGGFIVIQFLTFCFIFTSLLFGFDLNHSLARLSYTLLHSPQLAIISPHGRPPHHPHK